MALTRRKRNSDGSLGEPEPVFEAETDREKLKRLEETIAQLMLGIVEAQAGDQEDV